VIDDAHVYEMKCNFVEAKHLGCYNRAPRRVAPPSFAPPLASPRRSSPVAAGSGYVRAVRATRRPSAKRRAAAGAWSAAAGGRSAEDRLRAAGAVAPGIHDWLAPMLCCC